MGFIKSMNQRNKLKTILLYNTTETFANGQVTYSYSTIPDLNVAGLFFTGRAAERLVADKYKAEVSAVASIDYEDYLVTITPGAKAEISGLEYLVVSIENPGGQDKIIQFVLKNYV